MIKAVIFDMFETLITHYESPLYFGQQMAEDADIPVERFQKLWRPTEEDRTLGNLTLEEVLEQILRTSHRYSEELLQDLVAKRIRAKELCFEHLHPEILPMLEGLRKSDFRIGLISNCFSEEAKVIRESVLYPYFDAVYLSVEQGVQKPDKEIFYRCMKALEVEPSECLYVGDGGSQELETAELLGMYTAQAAWYLKQGTLQPVWRIKGFRQLESPLEVVEMAEEL